MSSSPPDRPSAQQIQALSWYHTIDLGDGLVTEGIFDHRPYLHHYGLPADLRGKAVLDIGAASGFFSFELERRGATVRATDLPSWRSHDFGPNYQPDQTDEQAESYLHQPILAARAALGSQLEITYTSIYDISPETLGRYDLVFCGSVLLHLTDPIRALWNIASVTREKAIIATEIEPHEPERPIAHMVGHRTGYVWWIPTRACLELMAVAAGFVGIEWHGDFRLDYRDGSPGPFHGVLHAYPGIEGWTSKTRHRDEVLAEHAPNEGAAAIVGLHQTLQAQRTELERLRAAAHDHELERRELQAQRAELVRLRGLVAGYESGRFIRLMRWLGERRRR